MTFCQDIYNMLCKKHPNTNIYVIGDHHLFHRNIIDYTRTKFNTIEEMNEYIISTHNRIIKKEDIVIFLGDFCLRNSKIGPSCRIMNGHKYLILGNHDPKNIEKKYYALGFEGVYTTPIKIGSSFLSHEPLVKEEKDDLTFQGILQEFTNCANGINYHGHIHTKDSNISSSHINVTCEAQEYEPALIGKTGNPTNEKPLFINSNQFVNACDQLKKAYGLESSLLLNDYIYSMMLESLTKYQERSFIQGSFGLYKKYGYASAFSDLDISCLYNPIESKKKNYSALKRISDDAYEHLKRIDGINLAFFKRYSSVRIFSASLAKPNAIFSHCYSDMNLLLLDCYRNSDFINLHGGSSIEKFLTKKNSFMTDDFCFPQFHVQTLKPVGDISNLLLQIMFQKDHNEKKALALKKLHYVYKHAIKDDTLENFLDTFIRFFLRNVALLNSWCRSREIEYIKAQSSKMRSLLEPYIKKLPEPLLEQIYDVLMNPNSLFLEIYNELVHTPLEHTFESCEKIMKKIK